MTEKKILFYEGSDFPWDFGCVFGRCCSGGESRKWM